MTARSGSPSWTRGVRPAGPTARSPTGSPRSRASVPGGRRSSSSSTRRRAVCAIAAPGATGRSRPARAGRWPRRSRRSSRRSRMRLPASAGCPVSPSRYERPNPARLSASTGPTARASKRSSTPRARTDDGRSRASAAARRGAGSDDADLLAGAAGGAQVASRGMITSPAAVNQRAPLTASRPALTIGSSLARASASSSGTP